MEVLPNVHNDNRVFIVGVVPISLKIPGPTMSCCHNGTFRLQEVHTQENLHRAEIRLAICARYGSTICEETLETITSVKESIT